jgi:hypothetical protein
LLLLDSELEKIGGVGVEHDELRPECLTVAILAEADREMELEHAIHVGMPSPEEQYAILDALDNEFLMSRHLTLHESLVWCEQHGLVDSAVQLN